LSICYVVPGHDLLSSVGPSRNVLNLAHALSRWADVTVAFRRVADDRAPEGVKVLEIQPGHSIAGTDDAAMRGIGYADFFRFMRALRSFTATELEPFDVVLEKSWLLSGYVSAICARRGQLGIPVENIVVNAKHAAREKLAKLVRLKVAHWVASTSIRQAPVIIAETEFLKKEIAQHWRVAPDRIRVVDLGVDRSLFYPREQQAARARLGIDANKTILLYVGVLDFTHNLEPVIRALEGMRGGAVELHLVGDGVRREEYRELAAATDAPLVFHGRVAHSEVPTYIAAGDLCLAPYDAAAFSSGELGYSTMKIPEYLSVGRAVASVPSGRIRSLVHENETGFLFANLAANWRAFLGNLPSRERLREMGAAAASTELTSWEDTARGYLAICEEYLQGMRRRNR
jgi:glycosyltransferase involved in cell wall biosynthesis